MKRIRHFGIAAQIIILLATTLIISPLQTTWAITQQDLYKERIYYFNLKDDATCGESVAPTPGSSSDANDVTYLSQAPSGSSNEQKIYNFFVGEVHLSPAGAAGIMGNMHAESSFDFTAAQTPDAWSDMSTARNKAVGLVQWDGGRRPTMINWAKDKHGTDPRDTTGAGPNGLVVQLNYIWYELNTISQYKDLLQLLKTTTDPGDAAFQWHRVYEVSSDSPDKIEKNRVEPARQYFQKYNGTTASAGEANTGCVSNASFSPDCKSITGNARILCAAKAYDPVSYYENFVGGHQGGAEWHKSCPTVGPSCYLDCSGLVNIAVYDVYKADLRENSAGERSDIGKYWQVIKFEQLQPGDLIQPFIGHVEIVDYVQGNTIFTFGAHDRYQDQTKDVAPANYTKSSGQLYLRYIGPGASTAV